MPMRMKITDLSGFDPTRTHKIAIHAAYWSLRMQEVRGALGSIDGVDIVRLVSSPDVATNSGYIHIDFPPVFDATGHPVPWNHILTLNPTLGGQALLGTIIQVYWDPVAPSEPDR